MCFSTSVSERSRPEPRPAGGLLRYLWVLPTSLPGLGLALLALLSGGRVLRVHGVLEVSGGLVAWLLRRLVPLAGGAQAMTLGHVVLGRSPRALELSRAHERVHVRQAERWGPLFVPAYLLASLAAWRRGEHFYTGNRFEREAEAADRTAGVLTSPPGSSPR